jgi:hypothetical protein
MKLIYRKSQSFSVTGFCSPDEDAFGAGTSFRVRLGFSDKSVQNFTPTLDSVEKSWTLELSTTVTASWPVGLGFFEVIRVESNYFPNGDPFESGDSPVAFEVEG